MDVICLEHVELYSSYSPSPSLHCLSFKSELMSWSVKLALFSRKKLILRMLGHMALPAYPVNWY